MACDFYWFFCRWPRILEFEFVKPGWNHRNPGTTFSPDHLWTYFRFRRTIVRCCPNRCLPETSKFSHTLQKFRICKFILIPMSQCPKNNYFYFFSKNLWFVQKTVSFCPVRTVRWRARMGIKSPSTLGHMGIKSKKPHPSKTSKSKNISEFKPNPSEYLDHIFTVKST